MEFKEDSNCVSVNLGQKLTIIGIKPLKNTLEAVLSKNKTIMFNAGEVVQVDTAGIQLLISFADAASRQVLTWEWQSISPTLKHIVKLLNIQTLLRMQ